jgi:hypothetical protein
MKKTIKYSFIAFLFFVISTISIKLIIPYDPIIIGNPELNDIAYVDDSRNSHIIFSDAQGNNKSSLDVIIPVPMNVSSSGKELSRIKNFVFNNISDVYWEIDGDALGFLFSTYYPNVRFPALLTEEGTIYVCINDSILNTNYSYPIQVYDDKRIIINMGNYPDNSLILYNMKECKNESVFYDGNGEQVFAVSSKGWLAINEEIDNEMMLNVYDNNRNLVFSDNQIDYYDFLAWSKDGNKLIYRVYKHKKEDYLYMHDFVTNESKKVAEDIIFKTSFSPDGNKIVMEKIGKEIVILDLITLQETNIAKGSNPDWRP